MARQIYKIPTRRVDILSREQLNYVQSPPELQVRRLSQQDWPYFHASALPFSPLRIHRYRL